MSAPVTFPAPILPTQGVMRILSRFDRAQLEGFVAVAIDLVDAMDGDSDIEASGDELDGSGAEDDFCPQNADWLGHPGCPISDPDMAVDDQGCDDINDDREEEETGIGSYGVDQTTQLSGPLYHEIVVDFDCGDAIKRIGC